MLGVVLKPPLFKTATVDINQHVDSQPKERGNGQNYE